MTEFRSQIKESLVGSSPPVRDNGQACGEFWPLGRLAKHTIHSNGDSGQENDGPSLFTGG
jgi:hypothetical protein